MWRMRVDMNNAEKLVCEGSAQEMIRQLSAVGWTQGTALNEITGAMCMFGAASFNGVAFPLLAERLEEIITELFPGRMTCACEIYTGPAMKQYQPWHMIAVHFNDNPATTFEDVMLVLKRAAEEN